MATRNLFRPYDSHVSRWSQHRAEALLDSLPVGTAFSLEGFGVSVYGGTWTKNDEGLWNQTNAAAPLIINCSSSHLGFVLDWRRIARAVRADAVRTAVERGQREIREDITSGRVDATVASFGELHDYVDANEYAGLCDDDCYGIDDLAEWTAFGNEVQDALDAWIKNGMR